MGGAARASAARLSGPDHPPRHPGAGFRAPQSAPGASTLTTVRTSGRTHHPEAPARRASPASRATSDSSRRRPGGAGKGLGQCDVSTVTPTSASLPAAASLAADIISAPQRVGWPSRPEARAARTAPATVFGISCHGGRGTRARAHGTPPMRPVRREEHDPTPTTGPTGAGPAAGSPRRRSARQGNDDFRHRRARWRDAQAGAGPEFGG